MSADPERICAAQPTAERSKPDRPQDPEMAEAFALAGVHLIPPRYVEEARVLDIYRDGLEASLEHQPPRPHELALIDTARRCRSMILLLSRKVFRRGLVSRKGNIRAELTELRSWLRLESDTLTRLEFRDGMRKPPALDEYLRMRAAATPESVPVARETVPEGHESGCTAIASPARSPEAEAASEQGTATETTSDELAGQRAGRCPRGRMGAEETPSSDASGVGLTSADPTRHPRLDEDGDDS